MQYNHILIRYGEISTKGRNRKRFIEQLRKNIQMNTTEFPALRIESERDRMFIKLNGEEFQKVSEKLKPIFGIQSFSLAIKVENELDKIKEGAFFAIKENDYTGKTFKISTRRSNKQFPYDTNELNHQIGGHILKNLPNITVNVHEPDINVVVEVRGDATYIMAGHIPGAGGMPVGANGKAMLMLSGGIDSPVAGFLTMKRGVALEVVHFFSPPYTNERARQKVLDLVRILTRFSGSITLHIVPFTTIQETIQKQVPSNYVMTSTRRMMLQITDEIRKKNRGLAIVTGESLGQVASQTLESMVAINEVTSTPILRPLISMDKLEIIQIAKEIDTHDISIRPYEDCCTIFTPSSPKTKPKVDKVKHYESYVDFSSLIAQAVEDTEIIEMNSNGANELEQDVSELF